MKTIIVHKPEQSHAATDLRLILENGGHQVRIMEYGPAITGFQLYQDIEADEPDMLCTVGLAGFNIKTDTGYVAYINLSCPNIHFITVGRDVADRSSPAAYEHLDCLAGTLSIAMFFYCLDRDTYDYLHKNCPDIPYLKLVANMAEGVEDFMREAAT